MYRMTPARKAALRKAQIASARKRAKGVRGKFKAYKSTSKDKRSANKTLFKSAIKNQRKKDKVNAASKRARRASVRATAARRKAASLDSKARRSKQKANRVQKGTQAAYKKRRKAVRKARRSQAWSRKK